MLLRTSLDHWLDVTFNLEKKDNAMAVTGYTATGAASMYAMLGDAEQAYHYLDFLIKHDRVSPTTMYAEGNPVIESPLSFATSIHDMLLQSWGGTIRVFPAAPKKWTDVAFHQLRTHGAFWVSAKRKGGVTEFVTVKSLIGSPCVVKTDISQPIITINGIVTECLQARKMANEAYQIELKKGDCVTFSRVTLDHADLKIEPIAMESKDRNLFGYSRKTERLPGHQHYKK